MLPFFKKSRVKETPLPSITLPLKSICTIDASGILYKDWGGNCAVIAYLDAYKGWCKSKAARRSKPKYVCDRAKSQKKIFFYTKQKIVFFAEEGEAALWIDILNRIQLQGYSSFDID